MLYPSVYLQMRRLDTTINGTVHHGLRELQGIFDELDDHLLNQTMKVWSILELSYGNEKGCCIWLVEGTWLMLVMDKIASGEIGILKLDQMWNYNDGKRVWWWLGFVPTVRKYTDEYISVSFTGKLYIYTCISYTYMCNSSLHTEN